MMTAQRSPLFQFAVRRGAIDFVYCVAVSIRLLLFVPEEDPEDVFLRLTDTRNI